MAQGRLTCQASQSCGLNGNEIKCEGKPVNETRDWTYKVEAAEEGGVPLEGGQCVISGSPVSHPTPDQIHTCGALILPTRHLNKHLSFTDLTSAS